VLVTPDSGASGIPQLPLPTPVVQPRKVLNVRSNLINRRGLVALAITTSALVTVVFPTAAQAATPGPGAQGVTGQSASSLADNTITVTSPGNQVSTVGKAVRLQIVASDSDPSAKLTYSAKGLPAGLRICPVTGLIYGTPTSPLMESWVGVTVTDNTGAAEATVFTWTVN
jgi:hypothetical protein